MAKLKDLIFLIKDNLGGEVRYTSPVSVLNDGIFSVGIPDEVKRSNDFKRFLEASLRDDSNNIAKVYMDSRCGGISRLKAASLDAIKSVLTRCLTALNQYDVEEKEVICFSQDSKFSFCTDRNGDGFYENGNQVPVSGEYQWQTSHSGCIGFVAPSIAVSVGLMIKKTVKTIDGRFIAVKYTRKRSMSHRKAETALEKLELVSCIQDFDYGGSVDNFNVRDGSYLYMWSPFRELDATEENAEFFRNLIEQVCMLSFKLKGFLSDTDSVANLIQSRSGSPLITLDN